MVLLDPLGLWITFTSEQGFKQHTPVWVGTTVLRLLVTSASCRRALACPLMTDDAVRSALLLLVVRDDGPGLVPARLQALQDHAAIAQGLPHAQGMRVDCVG